MSQQQIGSLALRAYPPAFRAARGEEMLGTLLDAGEDSRRAFIRGCSSLVFTGLRERAVENAKIGASRLTFDGFCLGGVLWSLTAFLSWRPLAPSYGQFWSLAALALFPAILVCALAGRDRLGGLFGIFLAAHALLLAGEHPSGAASESYFLGRWSGATVCFLVMALKPRVRSRDPRKLLWLIPGVTVTALFLIPHLRGQAQLSSQNELIQIAQLAIGVVVLLGIPLLGIFLLPIDPRLAIASALLWANVLGVMSAGDTLVVPVAIPLVMVPVLITVARQTAVRRRIRS